MRVIKKGFEREITCPYCWAILYYTTHDMHISGDLEGDYYYGVDCPECGKIIRIPYLK